MKHAVRTRSVFSAKAVCNIQPGKDAWAPLTDGENEEWGHDLRYNHESKALIYNLWAQLLPEQSIPETDLTELHDTGVKMLPI